MNCTPIYDIVRNQYHMTHGVDLIYSQEILKIFFIVCLHYYSVEDK